MRAHINPLNRITYPVPFNPDHVSWKLHYPLFYGGNTNENTLIYTNSILFYQQLSILLYTMKKRRILKLMALQDLKLKSWILAVDMVGL